MIHARNAWIKSCWIADAHGLIRIACLQPGALAPSPQSPLARAVDLLPARKEECSLTF
jgi:hypothetical protein